MYINNRCRARYIQSGFTMVELVIFIVIVSIAVVGILMVMNMTTANSADPQIRKQVLSIAEALMEEASQAPFTYCTDELKADGSTCIELNGTDTPRPLSALNGLVTTDIQGNPIPGLGSGYNATVTIVNAAFGGIAVNDGLHITVTVMNGAESVQLDGYRTRYMPGTQQ